MHGEYIIRAGSTERRMYIILEGRVMITLPDAGDNITIAEMGKGDFFGEITLFINQPRSANAIADGDVKLGYIDSLEQLEDYLMRNPEFAARMVKVLCRRLANTNDILVGKISELNRLKIMERL
jgi:CRP-like cAMP-binding protein